MPKVLCPNCEELMNSTELKCPHCGKARKVDFTFRNPRLESENTFENKKEVVKGVDEEPETLQDYYDEETRTKHPSTVNRPKQRMSIFSLIAFVISIASFLYWGYQQSGITVAGNKYSGALKVGDCIVKMPEIIEGRDNSIDSIKIAKCTEPHRWEVIYTGNITGNPTTESEREAFVSQICQAKRSQLEESRKGSSKSSLQDYEGQNVLPSNDGWNRGDTGFSCLLGHDVVTTSSSLLN